MFIIFCMCILIMHLLVYRTIVIEDTQKKLNLGGQIERPIPGSDVNLE